MSDEGHTVGCQLVRFKDLLTWSRNKVPTKGRENIMLQPSEPAYADLESLRVVIAHSPIKIVPVTLDARLADWARTRVAPDIDSVILQWIASHVRDLRAPRRFDA